MILVTGGSGLLGAHLLAELVEDNLKVRAIVQSAKSIDNACKIWNCIGKDAEVIKKSIDWVEADISNRADLVSAFSGVTKVYHCAAFVSFDSKLRSLMYQINVQGTANIVDCCLEFNIQKLIHVSSVAAIGDLGKGGQKTEDDQWPVKPKSAYSFTKTQAEMEVWRGITEGLNAVIVNPSVILGSGNWHRGSSQFFKAIHTGLKYFSDGVTGFVDVCDVTRAMKYFMNSDVVNERFILNGANLSYRELFSFMAEALKVKGPYKLATPFILSVAWRADWLKNFITKKPVTITKASARSANNKTFYSAQKYTTLTGNEFIPIDTTIQRIGKEFLSNIEK